MTELLFFLFPLLFLHASGVPWETLPGNALHISAKGNELWAVTKLKQVVRWSGEEGWKYMNKDAVQVAASPDGQTWVNYGNSPFPSSNLARFNPSTATWENQFGYATNINAISATDVVAIMSGYVRRLVNGQWLLLNPGETNNNYQVAIGDSDEIWKIDLNGRLYRYDDNKWQYMDKMATYVDVQSASRVVITDYDKQVWMWNAAFWRKLDNPTSQPSCIQATINYESVFCIDQEGTIRQLEVM